jgi:methyl-accepting chemotaxis protein
MLARMPDKQPKRRFLTLLRRTARNAQLGAAGRSASDESALWAAHDRALGSAGDAGAAAQRLSSHVARQRGAVDTVGDRTRAVATRAQELSTGVARVRDAFDKLGLVALNAGLEGARLGEAPGRALLLVSDEVRAQSTRGSEAARDIGDGLAEVAGELTQLEAYVGLARDTSGDIAQDASIVGAACSTLEGALVDIRERLRKTTGSDPETVRAVATVAENARSLVTSLTVLSEKVPRTILLAALRPALDPLARLFADEEAPEEEPSG